MKANKNKRRRDAKMPVSAGTLTHTHNYVYKTMGNFGACSTRIVRQSGVCVCLTL